MNYNFNRRFLDPAPGDGGGKTAGPSLADMDNPAPAPAPDPTLIKPVQATPTPLAPITDPPPAVEGVNDDGTLQEGYIKNDAGEVIKDPEYKPTDGTQDDPPGDANFWESVDKLRGTPLEVKFPDDPDFDPLSPEAALMREKAAADEAIVRFETHLQKTDPRGYAYLLHRQAGGSDDDFFKEKTFSLPEYESFKDDADVQVRVYKSALVSKGLAEEQAQMLVDKAVKDGKIFELADAEYKRAESDHARVLDEINQKQTQANARYTKAVNEINATLQTTVEKGDGMKWIIPDTEKPAFLSYLRDMVEYDKTTEKFLIVQTVSKEDLARQVEAAYLLYKKGDLSSIIQRKASSLTARRLGDKIDKSKAGTKTGQELPDDGKVKSVPLGSL